VTHSFPGRDPSGTGPGTRIGMNRDMAHQFGSAGYSREEVLAEIPITGFFFSVDVSMGTLAVDEPPAPRVRPPVDVGYFRAHETPIDPCWLRLAASFECVGTAGSSYDVLLSIPEVRNFARNKPTTNCAR
jgi:hypothetical protein